MSTNNKKLAIKSAIYQMGLRFNQEPSKEKIEAYANDLMGYTPEQITFAFRQVIASGTDFFPSMAAILKHLQPKEVTSQDVGNEVANELIEKILEFGRYKQGLSEALSPVAQKILEENRYLFLEILDSEKHQVPSIRAQIRDLVKAKTEGKKAASYNEKLAKIGIEKTNVIGFKRPDLQTIDFSGYLPEGDPA